MPGWENSSPCSGVWSCTSISCLLLPTEHICDVPRTASDPAGPGAAPTELHRGYLLTVCRRDCTGQSASPDRGEKVTVDLRYRLASPLSAEALRGLRGAARRRRSRRNRRRRWCRGTRGTAPPRPRPPRG